MLSVPIAIQNGKHRSLPPLLLPGVVCASHNYLEFRCNGGPSCFWQDPFLAKGGAPAHLESLAAEATKRRKISKAEQMPGGAPAPAPAASATPERIPNGAAGVATSSIQPLRTSPAPAGAGGAAGAAAALGRSKRQRSGPSCDACRAKKIKCDASVDVIAQDEALVHVAGDSLHTELTQEQISALPQRIAAQVPRDLTSVTLVKHIDKLVAFYACTSCRKRQAADAETHAELASADCACQFSKGYTRMDINVFTRLERQLGARGRLSAYSAADFKAVGF
ncbi:LAMI_0B03488g1_1 [Lachancea mirantina]|uniref:LAMI_0B03488g1_1 n=1 Tax=Lachancea mirantina TaxID=1230905 RepID=A0A1G4IUM6_9SACH|nr:LAMI_0B03488g1_1 [Lachancea mirantina]